jgi:4-amino-4-deoxy-L-arabinose transferase-like glycosyltransferase
LSRVAAILKRRPLAALVVACALSYLPRAGHYGLWDPWETHYAEIARQMAARGDVITPWWPGSEVDRPEVFHKPVLHFWLMAMAMKLAGLESAHAAPSEAVDSWRIEWAARVPNILLSVAALALLWWAVARLSSRRTATIAALLLATSSQWLLVTRQAMTDLPFVAPMTIALACAAVALLDPESAAPASPSSRRVAAAGLALVSVPQLVLFSIQLRPLVRLGAHRWQVPGVVAMAPYFVGLAVAIIWCARARSRRALLLQVAWVACALATLSKGPAGIGLPALVIALYLVLAGRARELWKGLELGRGSLLFAVVAFPWYHCMQVRHGAAFWRELIGDNYLHRAMGRSGDRGTFEYYVPWIGYGTFPWSGFVALGVLRALGRPRTALAAFALVWATVDVVTVTLVATKFHHYVLPALPAFAILGALVVDEWLAGRLSRLELGLVTVPVVALCGRDLAALPARLLWLFCYDYVLAPGVGRPWPSPAIYGTRYEYGATIGAFVGAAALLALAALLTARARPAARRLVLAGLAALALVWSLFLVDDFLVALSPHWSQKQVIAAYYRLRRGPHEPLIAWNLYWRGENLYTRNEISRSPDRRERTAWAYIDVARRMREYLPAHRGRRLFFLVERVRLPSLRAELPAAVAATLSIVDESNNKLYLVVVDNR